MMSGDNVSYLDSFDRKTAYATPPYVDPISCVLCSEMQTQPRIAPRKTFCTNAQVEKSPSGATRSRVFLAISKDKVQNIR